MSKLVQAVEASTSSNASRRMKPDGLFASVVDVKSEIVKEPAAHYQSRHSIRAKFGADVWVDDHLAADQLPYAVKQTKRAITEAVFGEFRPYFRELHLAVLDGKYDELHEILDRFERQMFEADTFE